MEDLDHHDWKLTLHEIFQAQDAAAHFHLSLFHAPGQYEDGSSATDRDDLARAITGSIASAMSFSGHFGTAEPDGTVPSCSSSADAAFPGVHKPVVGQKIDGRGRYKRWKSCDSRSEITPVLIDDDDGHAWRKYGQKMICGSDFPRSYYRCTHKSDQNCQAVKQVQQISGDPPLHQTTYYSRHTCKNTSDPGQFIIPEEETTFKLVSFDGDFPRNTMDWPSFFPSTFSSKSSDG